MNNAPLAGNETDQYNGTMILSPPLYNVRFNISNASFPTTEMQAAVSDEAQFLVHGVIEVILPDSEVTRLAKERKTLDFRLFSFARDRSHVSQDDDGSCNIAMNTTCRDSLITGMLYSENRDNTGGYPRAFQMDCGDLLVNDYGPVVAVQGVSGASAAPIFTSQSIPPATGVYLGDEGFFESNWNDTAIITLDNDASTLNNTSAEFNSYVRFIDAYNNTASRASLNSLNFGNTTQKYYDALALVRGFVVLERYIDPQDALNGTEYASVSCIRSNVVANDALQLPELYWDMGFNATTGNITDDDTSAATSVTVDMASKWALMAAILAGIVTFVL